MACLLFYPNKTLATAVARAYANHPERSGLLLVLAHLVAAGTPVAFPKTKSLPSNHRLDSNNLRAAALFVHTVIGRWSRDDAPLLAKEWLEQFNFMAFYKWVLIRIFREGFARRTSAAEALFLALYDSSSPHE